MTAQPTMTAEELEEWERDLVAGNLFPTFPEPIAIRVRDLLRSQPGVPIPTVEIGERLGISPSVVRETVYRARQAFEGEDIRSDNRGYWWSGPVVELRLKPQRPHVHRFRFDRPEGFIVRGRCECRRLKIQWSDGKPPEGFATRKRQVSTPAAWAAKAGREAWAKGAPAVPAPAESPAGRLQAVLMAAGGEFVSTPELGRMVYGVGPGELVGTSPLGPRLGADVQWLRRKFGRESVVSEKGRGYAWRGAA